MRLFILLLFCAFSLYAGHKGIYGADNRSEVTAEMLEVANATAMMVVSTKLQDLGDGTFSLAGKKYGEKYYLCPGERFAQQETPGDCSGFLVAPDILVTAGHCVAAPGACAAVSWVFGYYADEEGNSSRSVSKGQVYGCQEILDIQVDFFNETHDHAVIKLDRPVEGVTPLKFRKYGEISDGSKLMAIGNPRGLPTKVFTDGYVVDTSNEYWFATNLDTFRGNSGSAVIDVESGVVEGILVRGGEDFGRDRAHSCYYTRHYSMNSVEPEGHWEQATRITNINYLRNL